MNMIDIGTPMVNVDELSKGFGQLEVLRDLTLQIKREKITAIVGHNGSGKTTLIKTLLGLIKQTSGRIFIKCHADR